jgi:hypothetical protein
MSEPTGGTVTSIDRRRGPACTGELGNKYPRREQDSPVVRFPISSLAHTSVRQKGSQAGQLGRLYRRRASGSCDTLGRT